MPKPESVRVNGTTAEIEAKIKEQGDKVRSLKAAKTDKPTVEQEVEKLSLLVLLLLLLY